MRSRFHKRINRSKLKIEPIFLIKILLIIGLYIIFFMLLANIISGIYVNCEFEKNISEFAEKNRETVFEISEITLYSSANAKLNASSQSNLRLDISQFTDIYFKVSNFQNKVIQSLSIKDIEFTTFPESRDSCFWL